MRENGWHIIVLILTLAFTSCSNNDRAKLFGERAYSVWPLLNTANDDIPGLQDNTFAWNRDKDRNKEYVDNEDLAYALKVRSDAICDRFKVDLTLQQTGTNFLADLFSVFVAPIGAVAGGVTGQAVSAAQGAATGFKNTVASDIYQQVTGVVANYIDVGRNNQWVTIQNNLHNHVYGQNRSHLFDDIQSYHNSCSLQAALKTAGNSSGKEAQDAAQNAKKASAGAAAPAAPAPARARGR